MHARRLVLSLVRHVGVLVVLSLVASALAVLAPSATTPAAASGGGTERVSVASDGTQGNLGSYTANVSADGRYVAFESTASNLVAGLTGGYAQRVFVRDRTTGVTELVSVATGGAQADLGGSDPSISADGRYVAFTSYSSNLVAGDTGGWGDIFVRDRTTGVTERVSLASDGTQGNEDSYGASISADGRYVAFSSTATNLVAGTPTDGLTRSSTIGPSPRRRGCP